MKGKGKIVSGFVSSMMILSTAVMPVFASGMGVANGTQKAYIVNDDWGSGVSKTIMTLDKTIDANSVAKGDFKVVQTAGKTESNRTIIDA